jgi:hypothetical protein
MNAPLREAWAAPEPVTDEELITIDPRVDAEHVVGVLPSPANPTPPSGWRYWTGHVSPALGAFASKILKDSTKYPMGAFIQTSIDGERVAARVEWHDLQGATGRRGCFRGINLLRSVSSIA